MTDDRGQVVPFPSTSTPSPAFEEAATTSFHETSSNTPGFDSPSSELPAGYTMTRRGLVWSDLDDEEKPQLLLAGPFDVIAETRDRDGTSWGVLLRWNDHDGREHQFAIHRAMLAGDGAEARRALLDGGLYVAPGRNARDRLTAFLALVRASGRFTATSRIGWHGAAFVLPDVTIAGNAEEHHLLEGGGASDHVLHQKGSLKDWQESIARYAVGNSRLQLAVSAGFAAALIEPCGAESGGIHLRGASSTGKSTALSVAGSVWGGGEPGGYVRSWRATSNGLEGVALAHCDALLCLDELAELGPRDAAEVAYMLANGSGKSRSARDGSAKKASRWRVLFLSSGEISLAEKVAEGAARRLAAGQQVRVLDLPADAGAGLGVFEDLHSFSTAESFARHLKAASLVCYGTAAKAFVRYVVDNLDAVKVAVASHRRTFADHYVPGPVEGVVLRASNRFALIAAAGEVAVQAGVLPWPAGAATEAAGRCFTDWLQARGGIESPEIRDGIEQVRAFLVSHGMSRFVPAWELSANAAISTPNIAGFRKQEGDEWDYYVTTAAWRQICNGFNPQMISAVLLERGMLVAQDSRHRAKSIKVPGHNKLRLYHLRAAFVEGETE
jgi:uncharacterized protein (DUF927 family)